MRIFPLGTDRNDKQWRAVGVPGKPDGKVKGSKQGAVVWENTVVLPSMVFRRKRVGNSYERESNAHVQESRPAAKGGGRLDCTGTNFNTTIVRFRVRLTVVTLFFSD